MTQRRRSAPPGRSLSLPVGVSLLAFAWGCNPGSVRDDEPRRRDESVPGCINACFHDELPRPVDCKAVEEAAGVEFYPLSIWSMDRDGVASNMYSYTDSTEPYDYLVPSAWEPPANATLSHPGGKQEQWPGEGPLPPEVDSFQRCLDQPTNNVLHLFGGPFTEWGGGVGRGMKCLNGNTTALGVVKVGTDTKRPGTENTDLSCGAGPDEQGTPRRGACENTLTDSDLDQLIHSACPERDRRALEEGPASAGEEEFLLGMTLDVSEWDGISFWARRSPNSQPGIRIAVGDKLTDDDLRYQQYHVNPDAEPYCERRRECGCLNHRPCTVLDHPTAGVECTSNAQCNSGQGDNLCDTAVGRCRCTRDQECPSGWCDLPEGATSGYCEAMAFCFDPALDPLPESWASAGGERIYPPCTEDADCSGAERCVTVPIGGAKKVCWAEGDPKPVSRLMPPRCGEPACNAFYEPFQLGDAQFNDRACTPFSFRGGTGTAYCFDPGEDPDPVEGVDLCGDFWLAPVLLSTEWELHLVPFTELHQQGWAKEQFELDLTSLGVVRFTWDRGWIDYWIDDVRFYRKRR